MNKKIDTPFDAFDLFGKAVQPIKDPRGRPAYAKTEENQLLVMSLSAASWTHNEIAIYMQCDAKTLRKYYSRELDHGALFIDGMAMQVIVKKMRSGNLSAAKRVQEIAQLKPRPGRTPIVEPKKPVAPLGKKAAAELAAGDVPAGWSNILGEDAPQ